MTPEFWLAGAGLIVTIFVSAGGVIWKLGDNKTAIYTAITRTRTEIEKDVEEVRGKIGDLANRVQSRISEVELKMSEEYVQKIDFRDDLRAVTSIIESLGNRIETRLQSFELKLDELQKFNLRRLERGDD